MSSLSQFGAFLDSSAVYLTLQFERCAIFSFVLTGIVMLLRRKVFSRGIFAKGILWSLFLMIPFLGKLRLFYENVIVLMATGRLIYITTHCLWIGRIYMAGIAVAFVCIFGKRLHLRRIVSRMGRTYVGDREVRVTDMNITPFTIGLIRPMIVLPQIMVTDYSAAELETIVQHERIHGRLGHLWWYFAWDIIRCLIWVNPFLSVCQKYLRADLEDMCDRVCIQNTGGDAYAYGQMLLKSLKLLCTQQGAVSSAVTYVGEKEFLEMKRRIRNIAAFQPYRKMVCVGGAVIAAVAIGLLFVGIHSSSYARCSEIDSMLVYEYKQEGTILSADSQSLGRMIHYDDDYVYVDRQAFECFLRQRNAEGDIYIVFGGFQKFPGLGGGGCSCFYETDTKEKIARIPYEKPKENWMTILYKML